MRKRDTQNFGDIKAGVPRMGLGHQQQSPELNQRREIPA